MKKFFIVFSFFLIFSTPLLSDFIAFYPDVPPLEAYAKRFANNFNLDKTNVKFHIVKNKTFFSSPYAILKAVQKNLINFAVIPLNTFFIFDISSNVFSLIRKTYIIKNFDSQFSKIIPFKLELLKYGIFLIDLLPGGKYYIFSNKDITFKKNISVAVTNKIFFKKFKTIYPNTFYLDNLQSLPGLISKKIFNTAVLNTFDLYGTNMKFNNVFDAGLMEEKLCFIVNANYWKNMDMESKSIVWDFYSKYRKKYFIVLKKFQDRVLNRFTIIKLSLH